MGEAKKKQWTVNIAVLRRNPPGSSRKFDWAIIPINVIASSRKEALEKAVAKWNKSATSGEKYHIIPPARGGKGKHFVYFYYGRHILVNARSPKQLRAYIRTRDRREIGNFFIKRITVHPVQILTPLDEEVACPNCFSKVVEDDWNRGFCPECDEKLESESKLLRV